MNDTIATERLSFGLARPTAMRMQHCLTEFYALGHGRPSYGAAGPKTWSVLRQDFVMTGYESGVLNLAGIPIVMDMNMEEGVIVFHAAGAVLFIDQVGL
jgi:hypothetical protein